MGGDGGDADAAADFSDGLARRRAGHAQPLLGRVAIGHTPVGHRTITDGPIGVQREFVAGDGEADVERLVEVRLDAEQARVPGLGGSQVRSGIDDGAQSEEHAADLDDSRYDALDENGQAPRQSSTVARWASNDLGVRPARSPVAAAKPIVHNALQTSPAISGRSR